MKYNHIFNIEDKLLRGCAWRETVKITTENSGRRGNLNYDSGTQEMKTRLNQGYFLTSVVRFHGYFRQKILFAH